MKALLFFITGLFLMATSFSQGTQTDSKTDIQVKNALGIYNHYTNGNAPIYNGTEYLYYTFNMEGDPFFNTNYFSKGWISYEGRKYDLRSIMYDIVRNDLVILLPDSVSAISLQNKFIDSFNLSEHTFINLAEDHKQNLYNTGFYDVLYSGHIQLLARRIKTMNEDIKGNLVVRIFTEKDRFYIYKDGLYYLVTNKKEMFRLFADKNHEIKKMMRRENLKFRRKKMENILLQTVVLYDQLTP